MAVIDEQIVNFGQDRSLWGIFQHAHPQADQKDLCVIFLNAGLIHKIGPNRIYKKTSEAFSREGVSTFRFDFSGIGDSAYANVRIDGHEAYQAEVAMAINWVQKNKGINRFLLIGICTGATVAFLTSLEDARVVALSLIDGVYADEHVVRALESTAQRRTVIRYYKKNLFSTKRWIKVLSGRSKLLHVRSVAAVAAKVWSKLTTRRTAGKRSETKRSVGPAEIPNRHSIEPWKKILTRGVGIQLIFCEGDSAIDMHEMTVGNRLNNYVKRGAMQYIALKDLDHTFTPIWSQKLLVDLLTAWAKKTCERNAEAVPDYALAE